MAGSLENAVLAFLAINLELIQLFVATSPLITDFF